MAEDDPFFHEYYDQTTLHPVGLIATLILSGLLLVLPRRHAIFPIAVMACFIPTAQRVVISGLDFTLLRVLVVVGFARILAWGELRSVKGSTLDAAFIAWGLSRITINTFLYPDGSNFVYQAGLLFDAFGCFLVFRALVQRWEDLERMAWTFTVLAIPVAVAFLIENSTARNAFSIFGGVPETTMIRHGRLRCQGAFTHPKPACWMPTRR